MDTIMDTTSVSQPKRVKKLPGGASVPVAIVVCFTVIFQAGVAGGRCPHDVFSQASACLTDLSRDIQIVQNSPQALCCGIDVEYLRTFCQSYNNGMNCVSRLKHRCPDPSAVHRAMANLHGSEAALNAMCKSDVFIEVYSRHQTCLTTAGSENLSCFRRHLNVTDMPRLMTSVERKHDNTEFCSNMKATMHCIQRNVRARCEPGAAEIVATLVKPMIRHSTDCDYSHVTKAPDHRQGRLPPAAAYDSDSGGSSSTSGGLAVSFALLSFSMLTTILRTLLTNS